MKFSPKQIIPIVLCLILTGMMTMGAAPAGKPEKEPIDKIVFVHYPKENPGNAKGKPGGGGTGGTGTLSSTYKYSGIKWANPNVTYYVNPMGSGVDPANTTSAINAAMATWSSASGALNFIYNPAQVSATAGVYDYLNVISWGQLSSSNAIAITTTWYYRFSGTIVEVDTQMNTAPGFNWKASTPNLTNDLSGQAAPDASRYRDPTNTGPSGFYDIQNIMTHEAGHWLMLADLYNSQDAKLTMYGYGSTGELTKDTLGYGDEIGVERIYGP